MTGVWRFYAGTATPVIDSFGVGRLGDAGAADDFVAARLAGTDLAWVVLSREWEFDPHDLLTSALGRQGQLHLALQRPGVRVFSWQRHPQAGARDGG